MDSDRIGELQILQRLVRIIDKPAVVKFDEHLREAVVNLADYALPYEAVTPIRGKTLGITGMCLGLLAWVAAMIIPFVNAAVFAAVPLALVSAVLSVIAAKRSREAGFYNLFALVGMIAVALLINAAVLCGAVMLALQLLG